jgi:hypothetical protein
MKHKLHYLKDWPSVNHKTQVTTVLRQQMASSWISGVHIGVDTSTTKTRQTEVNNTESIIS